MKPEDQQIAIAELRGYIWDDGRPKISGWWTDPNGFQVSWGGDKPRSLQQIEGVDYLNDLNACAEMENHLPHGKRKLYEECLNLYGTGVFSDAAERREAFLRILNRWKQP